MQLSKIIRTPKAEVLITREDVRLIDACTELHYDAGFMRGLLGKLKIYVEDADPSRIVLEFCELDICAKMLEKAFDLVGEVDRSKAEELRMQIKGVLLRLNQQYEADNEEKVEDR